MISEMDIATIKKSVLFQNVPAGKLRKLVGQSKKRKIERGKTLFIQGDPAKHMFVVLSGWVKLARITPAGEDVVVAVYSEGESFGEAAALKGGVFPVTVEAATDCILLQVKASTIEAELRKDPDLALAMLSCTFRHLHELVLEIEEIKALNGAQRLATFLTTLAPVTTGSCTFSLPYDKILIAGRLGMKPESLSRSFANLREHGVTVRRQSVAIADLDQLRRFAKAEKPRPSGCGLENT